MRGEVEDEGVKLLHRLARTVVFAVEDSQSQTCILVHRIDVQESFVVGASLFVASLAAKDKGAEEECLFVVGRKREHFVVIGQGVGLVVPLQIERRSAQVQGIERRLLVVAHSRMTEKSDARGVGIKCAVVLSLALLYLTQVAIKDGIGLPSGV